MVCTGVGMTKVSILKLLMSENPEAAVKKCFPSLSDEDLNVLLPMKEEIVVNKIFTFSEESCLVYIHKKNAVFIELEKEKLFIPTVYTLWKLPEVCYYTDNACLLFADSAAKMSRYCRR